MITKKEDLHNTYIINDHGDLRDLFLEKCKELGLVWLSGNDPFGSRLGLSSARIGVVSGIICSNDTGRMLTYADLKPQTKDVKWDGEYQLENGSGWFKYKSTYVASNGDMFAMCLAPSANKGQPFEQYLDVETTKFRKLETTEQKLEREELEARKRLIDSSELPNGSRDKVSAILTMVEDVYGSGALFSVVDLLEGFNCDSGRYLQDQ